MKNTLGKINQEKINEIGEKYDLRFLILYGSASKNKLNEKSDIDIAFFGNDELSFEQQLELSSDLSSNIQIGYRILDLVDLKIANPLLKYEITQGGKLLYGDETDFADYQVFAFKNYIDGESLRNLEKLMIKKRQKALAGAIT